MSQFNFAVTQASKVEIVQLCFLSSRIPQKIRKADVAMLDSAKPKTVMAYMSPGSAHDKNLNQSIDIEIVPKRELGTLVLLADMPS